MLSDFAHLNYHNVDVGETNLFPIPTFSIREIWWWGSEDFITLRPITKPAVRDIARKHVPWGKRGELADILRSDLPDFKFEAPSERALAQLSTETMAHAVLLIRVAQFDVPGTKAVTDFIFKLMRKTGGFFRGSEIGGAVGAGVDTFFGPQERTTIFTEKASDRWLERQGITR